MLRTFILQAEYFILLTRHYLNPRNYFGCFSVAKELHRKTGISYWTLLFDILLSVLRLACPDDYKNYRFYEKSRDERGRFITDCRRKMLRAVFNPGDRSILHSKQKFNEHFPEFVGRQWLYVPDASDQQIEDFLQKQKNIIVKPHNRGGGKGIHIIQTSDIADIKAFCASARKKRLMLEEVIKQHPAMGALNPASVNTIRVITVRDRDGASHILAAILRTGRGESIVDNRSAGGIVALVDLISGVVTTDAVSSGDCQTYTKHPTTGVAFAGFQIPHWNAVREMVLSAAEKTAKIAPHLRWIGWDVAITEKGSLIVEGNYYPAGEALQMPTQTGYYHILRGYL